MNQVLLFLAMLCVASTSCVDLENICASDSFEYKGVLVNAFHRIQRNLTFESLNYYLINNTVKCNYTDFSNKTNFFEALKLKHAYNRKFVELYTEDLSGSTAEQIEKKWEEIMFHSWTPLHYMMEAEDKAKCVKFFENIVRRGEGVFGTLRDISTRHWNPISTNEEFRPTTSEAIEMLGKLMEKLKTSTDAQRFAFVSETAQDVYMYRGIGLFKEFKFLKEGSDKLGPDTKGMVTFDLLLPFNNWNHDNGNCFAVQDLTWFYKRKGKHLDG